MQPASLRSDDGRFTENHLVAFSKLRKAIELPREKELGRTYYEAGLEWEEREDAKLWEKTTADGLE
jgi:hypothetical protein